ncbi:hypothetical protein EDM80_11855 [bacterium]|nr:MAG: hypothetical protein EDM80_11855 [bacterium]
MPTIAMPTFLDLKQAVAATNGHIRVGRLRTAIREGELTAYRVSESCSAKILIDADELARWVQTLAGRNIVPSTREVAAATKPNS